MKISGSYASLLRGVSQQSPEVRQAGQHEEQINLISDPVQGLTRRRGSIKRKHQALPTPTAVSAMLAAAQGYRTHTHVSGGKEYDVLFRESLVDPAYVTGNAGHSPAVICYNRTDNVFVPLNGDAFTTAADTAIGSKGISALTSVGRLMVVAVKGVIPVTTTTNKWGPSGSAKLVLWVRGGAFDRTYSVAYAGGSFSYTTPAASVAGAATAISPQNIAAQLLAAAVAGGLTGSQVGAHLSINLALEATTSDGGDGSLLRSVYLTLDSVDLLPLMAFDGHVVKIQTGPDSAFYVKASAKTGITGSLQEVRWVECPGVEQGTTVTNFPVALVEGGTLRLALSPATLVGTSVPQFVPSTAGDLTSNAPHAFLNGKQITYLDVFQDRLIVGAGAAVGVSSAGDYFNFYRSSVVTVPIKDGFEMIAQGGEDDTLRHGVAYSRNLVIFGDKRQYIISGQTALTPTSANMAIMTTYADAADVAPIAAGGQIFYARNKEGSVNVHQIQPGTYVDSAESFPASAQISTYIRGPAAQLVVVPGAPSHLLVRSREVRTEVHVFSYLDQPDGRKQDAWYRWRFHDKLGSLMGVVSTPDGVLLFWLRHNAILNRMDVVVDRLPMSTALSEQPYFDSARPWADVAGSELSPLDTDWKVAFSKPSERFLLGGDFDEAAALLAEYPTEAAYLQAGIPSEAYVDLTNPYIRDGQQLAILTGRTVITKLIVNMKDSSGLMSRITAGGQSVSTRFNGRILGDALNQIGKVPVTSTQHSVPIGRETREYRMRLSALLWYPLTLIGIEWVGQSYNRTPRA